jgi:5'-nucleotidase
MKKLTLPACWIIAAALALPLLSTAHADNVMIENPAIELGPKDRLITILGTNDIHGGIEAGAARDGSPMGGMSYWSGVVRSIRHGIGARFGAEQAGVLVVDAGDQFQGTLLSNYSEGVLMFDTFKAMATLDRSGQVIEPGYDAIIPGNHDYDFGPKGWLEDQVTPGSPDQNPRGALEALQESTKDVFPMLSANTYLRSSIVDRKGLPVSVESANCKAVKGSKPIDWSRARAPRYLEPYVIKQLAGLRVALIGIDNSGTPQTTTVANVTDLCFGDEVAAYKRVRQKLEGKADVFVVIMHNGNTDSSWAVSNFVEKSGAGKVDAVVSGHTHWVSNMRVKGVPVVQSGSGGLKFGRIDLVYNTASKKVDQARTRSYGGIELVHGRCAPSAADFCALGTSGKVAYEGVEVVPNQAITSLVAAGRATLSGIAGVKLGVAKDLIKIDRTRESPLANAMTDALRTVAGADLSFINASGLRTAVQPGEFTYEELFKVIPFNNHGLVIGPMGADKVIALLERSIQTCGAFGALMQSGLRVEFTRDCRHPKGQVDPKAALVSVTALDGEVIYDASSGGMKAAAGRVFQVVTLDFLLAGGSGFDGFKGTPVLSDIGIVREALAKHYTANPVTLTDELDGRWSESLPRRAE